MHDCLNVVMVPNGMCILIHVFVQNISSGILLPGTARIFPLVLEGGSWILGIIVFVHLTIIGMGKGVPILLVLVGKCGLAITVPAHQVDISMEHSVYNV